MQSKGLTNPLVLGNLDAVRDWGYAGEYVQAMHLMLQQSIPEDFVIATGVGTTVRDFVQLAYGQVGIEVEWDGEGLTEIGVDKKTGILLVKIDPRYFRPSEVEILIGDATKAKNLMGWSSSVSVEQLCAMMVEHDISHT